MKNIKLILFLFCGLFLFSCVDDDENPEPQPTVDYTKIDVITGMDFFDFNGAPIGRWGFPNHKPGDVFVYPNPSIDVISISSQEKIKRIWLVPVDCFKDSVTMNITQLSANLTYEISELETAQIKDIPVSNFVDAMSIDVSDVTKGFYKLFYQMEPDEIQWYNIYIDPTALQFPDFDFMETGCQ